MSRKTKKDDYTRVTALPVYKSTIRNLPQHHHERLAKELAVVYDAGVYMDQSAESIHHAFSWSATPQGAEFWSSLYYWLDAYRIYRGMIPSEALLYNNSTGTPKRFLTPKENSELELAA